jgi:4-amino-4-deoxy-L-arabinose transferase-like glycosyltransferase
MSAMVLATSMLYLVMSKAVLTDIMLSVCMMAAFYAFYLWVLEGKQIWLNAFAVFAGLAVLTKGPVAIIILLLAGLIYLCWLKEYKLLREFVLNPWVLIFIVVAVPWYAAVIFKYGRTFVDEFIVHDNWHRILYAEHKKSDTWYFYPMVMTAGLFPWTFYLMMIGRRWKEFSRECLFFLIWIGVTFIIFQRAHSKLASYILPVIPAMVILLSISLSAIKDKDRRFIGLACMYGLLGVGIIIAPFILQKHFPEYLWPQAVWALRLFGLAIIGSAVYLWRGHVLKAMIAKSLAMLLIFLIASIQIPSSLDRAAADKYLSQIVHEQGYEGLPIVTNKLFARGIYFYTGNPVVVMDHNKQPFWSPHPIDVISDVAETKAFFEDKDRVLCVLKKSYKKSLDETFKEQRNNRVLAKDGAKLVILSEKIK